MVFFAVFTVTCAISALVVLAIILAALGQSIGLRKFYVNTLIKIFEVRQVNYMSRFDTS